MNPTTESFYAAGRNQFRAAEALRDASGFPTERLLQAVWRHQRLRREQLQTPGGQSVRVLHPGFASAEGGPDFRGAVIQVGAEPPLTGDVEIDLRRGGWRAHGHDRNPNFRNVILHVVWEAGVPASGPAQNERPPTLPINNSLDAPVGELSLWLESESAAALPENLRGKCSAQWRELDESQLAGLLGQAAQIRLEAKAAQFSARARHAGWEQALWEGLFRVLGYKHNVWPMQNLAETRPLWTRGAGSPFDLQARLLGIGGLLPAELTRSQKSSDTYLRRIWDRWWRERDEFADCLLPRAVWTFHGLRPANHPQRRLALAAHWLADGEFVAKIKQWALAEFSNDRAGGSRSAANATDGARGAGRAAGQDFLHSLRKTLQVERDEFWSWRWTFRSAPLAQPQPLLGGPRVTDLAVNVILPWLWARAAEGKNAAVRREMERRYFAWPAAEDNSVLKLARQRLLGTTGRRGLRSAATQQGLLQIEGDFCAHANALCENCRLPELVREFRATNGRGA